MNTFVMLVLFLTASLPNDGASRSANVCFPAKLHLPITSKCTTLELFLSLTVYNALFCQVGSEV